MKNHSANLDSTPLDPPDTDLPEGWAMALFKEIADVNPRHPKGLTDSMMVSFAPMAALCETGPAFTRLEERPYGEVRKGFTHFAEGDVLFAKITPCMENGKGAIATGLRNGIGCGTTELHVLRPLGGVQALYIYRFLSQECVRRDAKETFTSSAGQARVPTRFIEELEIPLPPLAEQKRIVVKVEELLARVDAARENLSKLPALLKRFRQSVLAAACSGRLTEDWRGRNSTTGGSNDPVTNANDGTELPDIPKTWHWTSLDAVCQHVVDCPHSTPRWSETGLVCARTTNFRPGHLDLSEVRYVSNSTFTSRIERLRPHPGDILYSREGGILGIACTIPPNVELCLGQRMMLFRANSLYFGPMLMHWLNSPFVLRRVQTLTGGSASPHLNVRDIKNCPVPRPTLPEQHEIVRRVSRLFALADTIEKQVAAGTARAEKLTQAILAKAFRGELVPTEAALARREGRTYEPAAALLARIGTGEARNATVVTAPVCVLK